MIPKGLLIGGGVAALGVGGYFLFKGDKPKEGATPESKDVASAGGKPGEAGAPGPGPTAGTPTGGMPGAGGLPGAGGQQGPGAPQGPGAGGAGAGRLQGQQVGPYTVVPDPASGMQIVFETATQTPVGVLDAQGNLKPITTDAQGNMTIGEAGGAAPGAGMAGAGTSMPTAGVDPTAGSVSSSPIGAGTGAGIGAPASQAAAGSQYRQLAESLFANAGDGSAGSAASAAMTGASTIPSGTTTSMPATASPAAGMAATGRATTPAATTTSGSATPGSGAGGLQVLGTSADGKYAVVADPASGTKVVVDTASSQPVGVLDAQGNLVPIEALTNGGAGAASASAGAGALAPQRAATPGAPIGAVTSAPAGLGTMPTG